MRGLPDAGRTRGDGQFAQRFQQRDTGNFPCACIEQPTNHASAKLARRQTPLLRVALKHAQKLRYGLLRMPLLPELSNERVQGEPVVILRRKGGYVVSDVGSGSRHANEVVWAAARFLSPPRSVRTRSRQLRWKPATKVRCRLLPHARRRPAAHAPERKSQPRANAFTADLHRGCSLTPTRRVRVIFSSLSTPPLIRPGRQRLQRLRKPSPFVGQSVATLGMVDKVSLPQFSEPRVEQSGVRLASVLQGPEGQRIPPKFPEHAQGRAPSQQVQSDHDGAAGGGAANGLTDTRCRHALLYTASDLR